MAIVRPCSSFAMFQRFSMRAMTRVVVQSNAKHGTLAEHV